jgi:hypothetical protein
MNHNVGGNDRSARLIVGSVLAIAGVLGFAGVLRVAVDPFPQALTALVFVLVGAILLVTGLLQWCPINRLLGRDTAPAERGGTLPAPTVHLADRSIATSRDDRCIFNATSTPPVESWSAQRGSGFQRRKTMRDTAVIGDAGALMQIPMTSVQLQVDTGEAEPRDPKTTV